MTPDALYSSSEVSLISIGVGALLVLRADDGPPVRCDWLTLVEPDHDLRTDSRLRPFRNRSKLSRTRAAALAFAAFFSTTFLARDGLDRCVVVMDDPERERACPAIVGSSGSRLCFWFLMVCGGDWPNVDVSCMEWRDVRSPARPPPPPPVGNVSESPSESSYVTSCDVKGWSANVEWMMPSRSAERAGTAFEEEATDERGDTSEGDSGGRGGREGWKKGGGGRIPCACELVKVRRVGELRSAEPEGVGRGREAEETADPVRACLLLAELEALAPRGVVVACSNLVESPTVDNEEGSCEGR